MKPLKLLIVSLVLALVGGFCVFNLTGCQSAPSERVQQVTNLKVVGASRDAAMKIAGQLWREGKISDAKRDEIIAFHDLKLQPAYNLAVLAVQSDLSSIASPDLIKLLTELQTLVNSSK